MKDVVAAVLEKDGKYLIAQRKRGSHLEYQWEFPGGKVEPGETPEQCLERELREEFRVETKTGAYITSNVFEYPHVKINLMAYFSAYVGGEFVLRDHEKIAWVTPEEMSAYDFAPADLPIIEKIRRNSGAAPAAVPNNRD